MPNKYRLWRGGRLTNHLSRLHHFRGHGVHSPFIYSIVRNVFMSSRLKSEGNMLLEKLHLLKINNHTAMEIVNLAQHCHYNRITIDSAENSDMIICSTNCSEDKIRELVAIASNRGIAIVILSPYKQQRLCDGLLSQHKCTSIDRLNYIIFLNNHLPKQHFKL